MSDNQRRERATAGSGQPNGTGFGGRGGPPPRGRAATAAVLPDPYRYTMSDLEEQTGFNARTIRFYVAQGLLPPAHGRGPSATYDLGHLLRLRAIQLFKTNYLPLDEIKERLSHLTDTDVAALLEVETAPPEDRWRRILLHPDIEIHVRERSGKGRDHQYEAAIEKFARHARLLAEDLGLDR